MKQALLLFASLLASSTVALGQTDLRLDQIQVIGTHNSYQMPGDARVMQVMAPRLRTLFQNFGKNLPPEQAAAMQLEHPNPMNDPLAGPLDYIQLPLEMQLRVGVRSLELDLQPDPKGGLYADPLPYRELRARGEHDLAPIYQQELQKPGLKVFHMADVDFRTQCPRFEQCLTILRQWSDANPGHSPVFILLEPKLSGMDKVVPGAAAVAPFTADTFTEIDAALQRVIGRERMITPDDVRGSHSTLEEAALAHAWPTVEAARGKFLFLFLVPGKNFKAFAPYLNGHESLQGRSAFVQGDPGMPHTAFVMVDNATAHPGEVSALVRKGYIVRSRADIDTYEARQNDTSRRDATEGSGAQIISSDYPTGPSMYGNTYQVSPFAGGFRCNPVTAVCK